MSSSCRASILFALALAPASLAVASDPDLIVTSYTGGSVLRFKFDGTPNGSIGAIGSMPGAQSLLYAPDGSLIIACEEAKQVLRFDGLGNFLNTLVADDPATPIDETGGLQGPTAAVMGEDGKLYVAAFDGDSVLRYDGVTGQFLDTFIPAGTGGLNGPDAGMTFGPDGNLYVPSFFSNRVLKFDGKTGALLGTFAGGNGTPMSRPRVIRFRGDGVAYITSWGNARVLRYKPNGQFIDIFATTGTPAGLLIDPDSGDIFVSSDNLNHVVRFDGSTKAIVSTVVPNGTPGLVGATFVGLLPDRDLHLSRPNPGAAGVINTLAIRGATPGASVLLLAGTATQSTPAAPCAKKWIGVAAPIVLPMTADGNGEIHIYADASGIPPGTPVVLQVVEIGSCRVSNLVVQTF